MIYAACYLYRYTLFNVPEFYELTDIDVPTFDVLSPGVMFRVVSKITRGCIITGERDGKAATETDVLSCVCRFSPT